LLLILALAHKSSLIVCPLGVSLAVEGHLINIRLIIGPRAFGAIVVSRKFIDRISYGPSWKSGSVISRDEQAGLAPEAITIGDFPLERKHNG
jgi:hypothetical protein